MLDVSIRAEILQLLDKLVRKRRIAMLYITHDLLSARLLSDEILVLNHGRVVEQGPASRVIREPGDEYTRLLLDAIPKVEHVDPRSGYVAREGEAIHVGASAIPERTP
jgi:peptide/nickel transport system ATP-binding protein